jgi:hypothetical protein
MTLTKYKDINIVFVENFNFFLIWKTMKKLIKKNCEEPKNVFSKLSINLKNQFFIYQNGKILHLNRKF